MLPPLATFPSEPPSDPEPPAPIGSTDDDELQDILARLGAEGDGHLTDGSTSAARPSVDHRIGVGATLTDPRDLTRPSSASGIVVEVGAGIGFDPTFATFGQRAAGAIIDNVIVILSMVPGALLLQVADGAAIAVLGVLLGLLGVLAVIVLGARALATDGKWIGNRVTGTTVVDAINGSFIDSGRAGLRMFGRHLISPILLFGYIVAFADGQRRTFHDRLASTVVVRREREVWTADDG